MVSEPVLERSAGHLFVGVLAVVATNVVGGAVAGFLAPAGVLAYVAIAAVGLYFGLKRVVLGVAVLADGILDARFEPVPDSSAQDPRNPFEIPLPDRPSTERGPGAAGRPDGGGDAGPGSVDGTGENDTGTQWDDDAGAGERRDDENDTDEWRDDDGVPDGDADADDR